MTEKEGPFHDILIKEISTFTYKQTLHRDRKNIFVVIVCTLFITAQILERRVNDCFEINRKQMIKMAKKLKLLNEKTL